MAKKSGKFQWMPDLNVPIVTVTQKERVVFSVVLTVFQSNPPETSVEQQITKGIKTGQERYNINKFIVYFQASTNTFVHLLMY